MNERGKKVEMEGEVEEGIRVEDEDGQMDARAGWRAGRSIIKNGIDICGRTNIN